MGGYSKSRGRSSRGRKDWGLRCFWIIGAIFCPPAIVGIKKKLDSGGRDGAGAFWMNFILLWLLWFPAIIHALYVVFHEPPEGNIYGSSRRTGRSTAYSSGGRYA